jgi:cbb3-type cytochrome oxidase subunit 3
VSASWALLLFGGSLVAVFAGIVVHYFGAGRRDEVEAPKYRMLEGDDRRDGESRESGAGHQGARRRGR